MKNVNNTEGPLSSEKSPITTPNAMFTANQTGATAQSGKTANSMVEPPNKKWDKGDVKGTTAPTTRGPSMVKTDDHKFKMDDARMAQPPFQKKFAKGVIPVSPSSATTAPVASLKK